MSQARTYRWTPGAHLKGDAEAVGRELERISATGKLTAEAIVKAARAKRSPLHAFIYDGTTAEQALEAHRIHRARYLLRSIEVIEGEAETIEVRGFEVVTIDGDREYLPSHEVRDSAELRREVRERMVRELVSLRRRLRQWDEFVGIVAAIDILIAQDEKLAA